MSRLPVIVGFGGVNPAGRSSLHHSYRRLVIDALPEAKANQTFQALAGLMGLPTNSITAEQKEFILDNTLIRKLGNNLFDADNIPLNRSARLQASQEQPVMLTLKQHQLPEILPPNWTIEQHSGSEITISIREATEVLVPGQLGSKVRTGGQLPSGFDPESLYQSRNHPRGLQLTVYGASDAVNSLGIDWEYLRQKVPGDRISVYASSAMGQLDTNGSGGMLQARLQGKRVSSKNCPLGLAEMIADFVNAYVIGSVGTTGANIGACATFLYNLRQGVEDIRSGKSRIALVGASEAPLTPEVIEGYSTMNALAEDAALARLDGRETADHRRACRPFGDNCGFTLAESAQFVVLFDDELAMETGANIYGAVADVFINADGYKKSIPGPGIGNYLTMGKAMGTLRAILGEDALRNRSYVHAHGTGTPQNRVTESHIFNELAKSFGIQHWPVTAIKSYVGHSLAPASADQMVSALGTWHDGLIPGIVTSERIADDVHQSHLDFLLNHREVGTQGYDATLLNSKGFGGNNATAAILAPHVVREMLGKKHGNQLLTTHSRANEAVQEQTATYDQQTIANQSSLIYRFGEGVIDGQELNISADSIQIPGQEKRINLEVENPYKDMV